MANSQKPKNTTARAGSEGRAGTAQKRPTPSAERVKATTAEKRTTVKQAQAGGAKKAAPKNTARGQAAAPSNAAENRNIIMPYILAGIAALLAILYVIVFVSRLTSGTGEAGVVGNFLQALVIWLGGWASYLIPALLGVAAFRWRKVTATRGSHTGLWVQFAAILIVTATILQLFFGLPDMTWDEFAAELQVFYRDEYILPGGLFGGALAIVMCWALRMVFSLIVLIVIDLLLIVFYLGLTPEVIFRKMRTHHAESSQRRADYLRKLEQARAEEAKLAAEERERAEKEALEEEKLRVRKQREEEALRRAEEKRRIEAEKAAEEADRLAAAEAEARRLAEEEAREAERLAAEAEAIPDPIPEANPGDIPSGEIVQIPPAPPEDELLSPPVKTGKPVNPVDFYSSGDRTDKGGADLSDTYFRVDDADAGYRYPLATDLDYDLMHLTEKKKPTSLPGDEDLLPPIDDDLPEEEMDGEAEAEEQSTPDPDLPPPYVFPPVGLMAEGGGTTDASVYADENEARKNALGEALQSFGIRYQDIVYSRGPTITRYEITPQPGQRVRAIQNLMDDIAIAMRVSGVRYEPSIPGKPAVGIEVPNASRETVFLRSLIESGEFAAGKSRLTSALGQDVAGNPVIFDITKMPHLLVAGATGMGKSVCINSIIVSLLYKSSPEDVRLVLIDPKKVEFTVYRDMPHLFTPIISDPSAAAGTLASAVGEMEKRFTLIERVGARDIGGYKRITAGDPDMPRMPHIVIIIDELADLMMTASGDVEKAICRLAQKARAAGIHLIIGTQRPSVDVITGTIKANIPSRIAFTVASQIDSRTILDAQGAEKLCGRGDMLFAPVGVSRPQRVQGSYVSEEEVEKIVKFIIRNNGTAKYDVDFMQNINAETERLASSKKASAEDAEMEGESEDPKLGEAVKLAINTGKISTSLMQRNLSIGYGRAAKILDHMEKLGYISPQDGNKPRKILITMEEYEARCVGGETDAGDDAPF